MRKARRRSTVAALGATLLMTAVPAPAQAQPTHPCYLHTPITAAHIWQCLCADIAETLSPVIPPDQWDCGFPDIPPGGGEG